MQVFRERLYFIRSLYRFQKSLVDLKKQFVISEGYRGNGSLK